MYGNVIPAQSGEAIHARRSRRHTPAEVQSAVQVKPWPLSQCSQARRSRRRTPAEVQGAVQAKSWLLYRRSQARRSRESPGRSLQAQGSW